MTTGPLPVWEVVCLTGHRPQHLSSPQRHWVIDNLGRCAGWLRDNRGTRVAITGMALFSDLVWADAAVRAGLELWCYIPYPQQPENWTARDRGEWERLRAAGNPHRERIFADRYSKQALHARNRGMLTDADAVVSVWRSNKADGGTYQATVEAARRGMPGIHLDPAGPGVRHRLPTFTEMIESMRQR